MQTFIPFKDITKSAECLDNKRLGKQRIETVQIARCLLGLSPGGWKNHPAIKMWKGYEPYLIKVYLKAMMDEWEKRGFNNDKTKEHYKELYRKIRRKKAIAPPWITDKFCISHQSNLLRKNEEYYSKYFSAPKDLPYLWPM
jgi:hypothetical protein